MLKRMMILLAVTSLHLLHGKKPSESWVRAMNTSLILYAEHEFNASTFTARVIAGTGSDMYSCITELVHYGSKNTGCRTKLRSVFQSRYHDADQAEADIRERVANKIVIGFRSSSLPLLTHVTW